MNNFISLSICIPAFNEEDALNLVVEDLIAVLLQHIDKLEIIIVNDGSRDSTFKIAYKLSKKYDFVKIVKHESNQGIGSCFRDALMIAKGEYFTWFPADYENSAYEIVGCLGYLNKSSIITSHHKGFDSRSKLRKIISIVYTLMYNSFFGLKIKYYNGLTIFPVETLRSLNLRSNGFAIFAESIIKSLNSGVKIVELSIPLNKRSCGRSKSLTLISFLRMVRDMRWILKEYKPVSKLHLLI